MSCTLLMEGRHPVTCSAVRKTCVLEPSTKDVSASEPEAFVVIYVLDCTHGTPLTLWHVCPSLLWLNNCVVSLSVEAKHNLTRPFAFFFKLPLYASPLISPCPVSLPCFSLTRLTPYILYYPLFGSILCFCFTFFF